MPLVTWDGLGEWWLEELASDPAYSEEIEPLLLELLQPQAGLTYLDLGCGDGRMMGALGASGARVIGCDLNLQLLRRARRHGPVAKAVLPGLAWIRAESFDGALVGLVLEHLEGEATFFQEAARVVRPRGALAVVINHPIWTAPESSPIEDAGGEILWRPGQYFGRGYSDEPAGHQEVRFFHRTMEELLNAAADADWHLVRLVEQGISPKQVRRYPDYAGQEHIPRVLGVRWVRC